jgi:hypothetical protein
MFVTIIALAAVVQATPPLPVVAGAVERDTKPKLICKSEQIVGSLLPKRICHTREQWAAIAKMTQDDLDQQRRYSRARSQ